MTRFVISVSVLLVVIGGANAYRGRGACAEWQERYKRFTYLQMMRQSPVIYSFEEIEEIIGEQPLGCDREPPTEDDISRLRSEDLDPIEFLDEERAAAQ